MENQLVSIIVPVYNVEKYLRRCIDSIICQTYKNLEIILVDDGSTDNSAEICDEYRKRDERVVVIHQKNGGPATARNTGLEVFRGEFATFIDSDDLVKEVYIEKMVKSALKYNAGIVQCRTYAFMDFHKIDFNHMSGLYTNETFIISGKQMCHKLLFEKNANDYDCVHSKLYSRKVFRRVRFPGGRRFSEDTAIAYLLYWSVTKVVVIDEPLYLYQSQRKDSLTHDYKPQNDLDRTVTTRERMLFFKKEEGNGLFCQSMYLHCNTLIASEYRLGRFGKKYRNVVRSNRKELKCLMKDIASAGLPVKKKILVFVGNISPYLWYRLWEKRNQIRKNKVWKEREKYDSSSIYNR